MYLLILVLAISLLLLWRGLRFVPKAPPRRQAQAAPVDGAAALSHLQQLVQLPTISAYGVEQPVFEEFRQLLRQLYPKLHTLCPPERIGATGLLFHIPGRQAEEPTVLMGHYDVVPVEEAAWQYPPFGAVLADGRLWGRGTLDMKNQLCATLEAAEQLLQAGFCPAHDIYLAFSGEEEIMGESAALIRDTLQARGLRPALVLDEGGDIMDGFFPGAAVRCAMIGIGEKGAVNVQLSIAGGGGHASTPVSPTPLFRIARAITRLEGQPWPMRMTPALDALLETMGRYSTLPLRVLFANRRLLRPLVFLWLRRQGGMLLAMSRTTLAPTMASGSSAANVLPSTASAVVNLRLLPGDSIQATLDRMKKIIRDDGITLRVLQGTEPQAESAMDGSFTRLTDCITETWPEAIPTPYLMVATTDSRHYQGFSDHVYRFSAKQVTAQEKATVHGNNERIAIENTQKAVQFYLRLMQRC